MIERVRRIRADYTAGAIALALLVGSLVPVPASGDPVGVFGVGLDVWMHFVGYLVLAWALARALDDRTGTPATADRGVLVVALTVTVVYGIGIEGLQGFVPSRTTSAVDAAADGLGALVGCLGWWGLRRERDGPQG